MNKKQKIYKLIDEYAGKEYRFLINYLDGGYEDYLEANYEKLVYKKVFGKYRFRNEKHKNLSKYMIMILLQETCSDTLKYIKNNLKEEI